MFGIGIQELLLIFVVAMIVLGPKKLPELAKTLGRAAREFKKASNDLKTAIGLDEDDEVENKTKYSKKTDTVTVSEDMPSSEPSDEIKKHACTEDDHAGC
ncbi:twin-arginine translocase TatA/TatE family subunit [Desulforegula conservatrix]|uniref:twin-arginine translocase TatA/TatE family subunit n=1 Tax=Desulforegula conservatrix TaxID=153026 RepID=UPI00041235A7|nr:twin-arginine translocase TatA/TatE family subunit [Desulforegula conservatrix]